MLLSVPYHKQETLYDCGSACLQMVLEFYGKNISQEELGKRLGTRAEVWASNEKMEEIAQEEGFHTLAKIHATLTDLATLLKKNTPAIVNYIEPEDKEGHFAVVVGMDEENIILNDPWHGEHFSLSKKYLLEHWRSFDGDRKEWILAISPEEISLVQ